MIYYCLFQRHSPVRSFSIIFLAVSKTCSSEKYVELVLISPNLHRSKPVFIKDMQLNAIRVKENATEFQ